MTLTLTQIGNILKEIDKNLLVYISVNLGRDVLSGSDQDLLRSCGINPEKIVSEYPPYYRMFLLGRLTQLIGDFNSSKLDYSDFEQFLKRHQYAPLTQFEKTIYELARRATYTHLKHLTGVIRRDVETGITEQLSRTEYERIIKKEIETGVAERKSVGAVVSDIGHRTGDWAKDLNRIVDTEMNNIFQQGRAVEMIERAKGKDPLVYKDVFEGACRHCIAFYLTAGLGSEPRVFHLSDLLANGSNIGRKVVDWKATVNGVHPHCRCLLRQLEEGKKWDKETKRFEWDKEEIRRREKELGIKTGNIKVSVGSKSYWV